ncbi:hypothetical protein [Bacillus paramycoides]|uniref:hypothetical protein n=1 Tax=Bacillus paramycoides TaxID=2026194 RepID=UPI002E1D24E5|nr:hypothetical protein [Bacillus paramycoides]
MTAFINGKYLDVNEALAQQIFNKEGVKKLLTTLNASEGDFHTKSGYAFDIKDAHTGKILAVETYVFVAEKAQIHVKSVNNGEEVAEVIFGDALVSEKGIVENYEINNQQKVEKINVREDVEGFGAIIPAALFDDENYKPLSSSSDIEEKDLPFCLSPYKHCGPGCGDFSNLGGGTPINRLDSCCKAHDTCWHNFGAWDPCCDKNVVRCAQQNWSVDPVTAAAIQAAFIYNSNKC